MRVWDGGLGNYTLSKVEKKTVMSEMEGEEKREERWTLARQWGWEEGDSKGMLHLTMTGRW